MDKTTITACGIVDRFFNTHNRHSFHPAIIPGKEIYIAAGFGLVHGLAFASILSNLDLEAGRLALRIPGFYISIELMQLFWWSY